MERYLQRRRRLLSLALNKGGGSAPGYSFVNVEAAAYVAAMDVPPDDTRKAKLDAFFTEWKASGALAKRDVLVFFGSHNAQAGRLNLKNPATFTATLVNAPTFTADVGFDTNGSNSEIDTNYNPTSSGGLLTQNSLNFAVGSRTAGQTATGVGWFDGADGILVSPRTTSNTTVYLASDSTISNTASASGAGWFATNRNAASGAGAKRLSKNGALVASDSSGSVPLNSATLRIGRGATAGYSARLWWGYAIGGSLSQAEEMAEFTAISNYFTSIGQPI